MKQSAMKYQVLSVYVYIVVVNNQSDAAASHPEPTDSPVQRESAFNALLDVQSVS